MSDHHCIQLEFIGRVKEFIEGSKGVRGTLTIIAMTILLQVGTFLYLWGGLTTTVRSHDQDISTILRKLDSVKIVYAEEEKTEKKN